MNFIELLALTDIIGVVGVKYMIEQVNTLIYENLIKIKSIVSQNKEVLQSLRINFDRPDMMKELYKRLESKYFKFLIKNCFFKLLKLEVGFNGKLKAKKQSDKNQIEFLTGIGFTLTEKKLLT